MGDCDFYNHHRSVSYRVRESKLKMLIQRFISCSAKAATQQNISPESVSETDVLAMLNPQLALNLIQTEKHYSSRESLRQAECGSMESLPVSRDRLLCEPMRVNPRSQLRLRCQKQETSTSKSSWNGGELAEERSCMHHSRIGSITRQLQPPKFFRAQVISSECQMLDMESHDLVFLFLGFDLFYQKLFLNFLK